MQGVYTTCMLIPHLFAKEPIPAITNPDLLAAIELVRRAPTVEAAMQKALDILSVKFESKRFRTYLLFWKAFEKDPNTLWERKGFLHCTHQNYLFRVLMVKSEKLTDDQITLGFSFVWDISIHQYLIITVDGKRIAADPWNYDFGATLGKYASGFGMKRLYDFPASRV